MLISTEFNGFESVVYLIEIKGGTTLDQQKETDFRLEINKINALNHYFAVESEVNKVKI